MNASFTRSAKKSFRPAVNMLEERALLSTFGGGNVNLSIPVFSSTAPSMNFTSNTFNQINNSILSTARAIVANPSNTLVVDAQLTTLVARIPYGQANLLPALEADIATFNKGSVPITTAQASASVNLLYQDLLATAPSSLVLASDVTSLQNGVTTVPAIATGLVTSSEFLTNNTTTGATTAANNTQFVTSLYTDVLQRAPEAAGLTFWENQLNTSTLTTSQVATDFIQSIEATASTTSVLALAALPAPPMYYFGVVAPGAPNTGNFAGTSNTSQVQNLLQRDIIAYLVNGISTSFNVLKSHVNFTSDKLLTYNGRVS